MSPESEEYMRIMAIDYGDAHTGIAVSDPTGLLAGFTDFYPRNRISDHILVS